MSWAEMVSNFFSNPIGYVLAFIVIIVVLVLLKKGRIRIHTKVLTVGEDENERKILRVQLTYLHAACDGMIVQLPDHLDRWRTKAILGKVADVLEEAALYNHIKRGDKKYYDVKCKLVYNTVMKEVEDEWFLTDEFRTMCNKFVTSILDEFVDIRESYA